MTRTTTAVALSFTLVVVSSRADAAPCAANGMPAVAIRQSAADPALGASVAEQLRASLAERGIALCIDTPDAPADGALATLDVSFGEGAAATLTLTVKDAVTNKRVARDVDLASVPADARGLVVASAADELLRASWAEILVKDAPPPAQPVPPVVASAVETTVEAPRPVRAPVLELGLAVAGEAFGGGHAQLGPDLVVAGFPSSRVGVRARFGLRDGGTRHASDGTIASSATVGALGLAFGVLPRERRFGVDVVPELALERLSFDARAAGGAVASSDAATAIYLGVGAQAWWAFLPPSRVGIGLAIAGPLRGVRATDAGQTITSASGVLGSADLLFGVAF